MSKQGGEQLHTNTRISFFLPKPPPIFLLVAVAATGAGAGFAVPDFTGTVIGSMSA
jgi:hypothetical protein